VLLPRTHASETILIVEDNENVCKCAVSALERLGYSLLTACDGSDAALYRDRSPRNAPLIPKPYDIAPLARKVRELIDARRHGAAVIPFRGAGPAA